MMRSGGIGVMGLVCWLAASAIAQGVVYVNGATGDDAWSGRCAVWDGSSCGPKATIQAGIDAAVAGDDVLIADGVYAGAGNHDLDFGGKAITLRSAADSPAACIIDCRQQGRGVFFHTGETADSVVRAVTIRNGAADAGGGIYCEFSSPMLVNSRITGNAASDAGGGVYCYDSSLTIANCAISGNTASAGGAAYFAYNNPTLTRCAIAGNAARDAGGGVYGYDCSATLTNCTVTGNAANTGAGLCFNGNAQTLVNCTLTGNLAADAGGGMYCDSSPSVTNSILWGDTPQEIYVASGDPNVTYSDVQGGWTGTANVDVDPGFAFPADVHLMAGSTCIDAGTNVPPSGLPPEDLEGQTRPLDGDADGQALPDMGAYEFNRAAPAIAVSTPEVIFSVPGGQTSSQALSIRNSSAGALNWSVEWQTDWLTADPSTGQSSGEIDLVTLTIDATHLARGRYDAVVRVTDPQAANSPRTVWVVLFVRGTLSVPNEYATIQAAIDAALPGDEVVIANGVYQGPGNRDLDSLGKAISIHSASDDPWVCVIDCDQQGRGFYFHTGEKADSIVRGLTVRNGAADYGGAVYCIDAAPTIRNCIIAGSVAENDGGGVYCWAANPTLENCAVAGNAAHEGGGLFCDGSSPMLTNCTIADNTGRDVHLEGGLGGGVYCSGSSPILANCVLRANTASMGGGAYLVCDSTTLTNCTIVGNTATNIAGAVCAYGSSATLTNCILWGDTPQEIYAYACMPDVTYCDVQGGWAGAGNIAAEPPLAFPTDFHLLPGSPCLDTGTNDPPAGLPPGDMEGQTRPIDGDGDGQAVADIGAYEFNPAAPAIALSATELTFSVRQGQAVSQTLSIRNSSLGTLAWSLDWAPDWLTADPALGESSGEIDAVTLTTDGAGLGRGWYHAVLWVRDPQASNSPRAVTITMYVAGPRHVPAEYATIQAAIDAVLPGDEVVIADGIYAGVGNRGLDFHGKATTVRSASNDPSACVIDCEYQDRGFYFHSGETVDSMVQGLTIRNGSNGLYCLDSSPLVTNCTWAGNSGDGVICSSASPLLTNSVITGNYRGVYCDESNPVVTGCTISANGEGVYCWLSNPTLTDCTITDNDRGVYCGENSAPTLTNCNIARNVSYDGGAALRCEDSSPLVTECMFTSNTALDSSGGAIYCAGSNPTFANCTISANENYGNGGGIYLSGSNATLNNCTLSSNWSRGDGGGLYCENSSLTLSGCTIRENTADNGNDDGNGGGLFCVGSGPTLTACRIDANAARAYGGGVYWDYCDPLPSLTNCTITNNTAFSDGGGAVCRGPATLTNCRFTGNTATNGGGLCGRDYPRLVNCILNANRASNEGGGVYGTLLLVNCTLTRNTAAAGGGAIDSPGSKFLANCILWADTPREIGGEVYGVVMYCDIQGGCAGTGNIDADPGFAFADDFHLLPGSPCVDVGINTPWGSLPPEDFEGQARPLDGDGDGQAIADMGAYEFNPAAPTIALSPAELTFYVGEGQTASQTLTIRNSSLKTLAWSAESEASWLAVHPVSGESSGEINEVAIIVDTKLPTDRFCTSVLRVIDSAASNSPREVSVALHVTRVLHVPAAYATIQEAIDAAAAGDEVVIADGTYAGPGNRDLDFKGKPIMVRSVSGDPATCIIDCEEEGRGFYFHRGERAAAVVQGLTIAFGIGWYKGGGVYCVSASPTLKDCTIAWNWDSGVYCEDGAAPTLTKCTINDNAAGGVYCEYSAPRLNNCNIAHNGGSWGGGVACNDSNPILVNCVIAGNQADRGAGVHCWYSSPTLANCTITGNYALEYHWGGALYCYESNPVLVNCVVWSDYPDAIYLESGAPVASYCDIQGGWPGDGNIEAEPLFANPYGPDGDPDTWWDNDYRLSAGSPCIDAGDPAFVPQPGELDLDELVRSWDGNGDGVARVDMGAYEFESHAQSGAACCHSGGACAMTTEADCMGIWHSEWIDCSVAACPQPSGACCDPDGACAVIPEAACSGVWTIFGTCDPNPCPLPTGSCCDPDGTCALTLQAVCGSAWTMFGTCDPNSCPQPTGSCCGLDGTCVLTFEAGCSAAWTMFGTCDPNPCPQPTGACCDPDGTCTVTLKAVCGGAWTMFGTCDPNSCPQPTGSCCGPDGTCALTFEAACSAAWTIFGTCSPNPCPLPSGSCCALDGACGVMLEADCSGMWTMFGACNPNPCPQPTGSCCAPDATCAETFEADCGGVWTLFRSCDPNPCPPPSGACCLRDDTCQVTTEAECPDHLSVYHGDGTGCEPNPCQQPIGACCLTSGGCRMATADDCAAAGGVYKDHLPCALVECRRPCANILSLRVQGEGTVAALPARDVYECGAVVELTATPAECWHFVGWTGAAIGSANPASVTMDDDRTVTAVFAIDEYVLEVSIEGEGSVALNPAVGTYDCGDTVHLTATAESGWHFADWSGDATGPDASTSILMDADRRVTAIFEPDDNQSGQRAPNPGPCVGVSAALIGLTFAGLLRTRRKKCGRGA